MLKLYPVLGNQSANVPHLITPSDFYIAKIHSAAPPPVTKFTVNLCPTSPPPPPPPDAFIVTSPVPDAGDMVTFSPATILVILPPFSFT